jgi:hypothetical protein
MAANVSATRLQRAAVGLEALMTPERLDAPEAVAAREEYSRAYDEIEAGLDTLLDRREDEHR